MASVPSALQRYLIGLDHVHQWLLHCQPLHCFHVEAVHVPPEVYLLLPEDIIISSVHDTLPILQSMDLFIAGFSSIHTQMDYQITQRIHGLPE